VYIVFASIIIVVFFIDAFIMPWIVHSRSVVTIPNVTGRTEQEAKALLIGLSLHPVIAGTTSSRSVPQGSVAYQNPEGGGAVREGRNVYLTLSGGEEVITMPNLRGRSLRDAKITLEQFEIYLGRVEYNSSSFPNETVLLQSLSPGSKVKKNAYVDITVSSGNMGEQIDVPNLVSLSLDNAQQRLLTAGLRLGKVAYKQSSQLVPNTVIAQSPSPGDKVDRNTPIDITVVH
jgi:eukaryotic-like serine/threonine-protein kinase